MHESGEWISQSFTVQLTKQDAQGAGSAITYCRRYGLQSVAGIPSEDDDGNSASSKPAQKERALTETDHKWIKAINSGVPLEEIEDKDYRKYIKANLK
jgi:hypothetical protein